MLTRRQLLLTAAGASLMAVLPIMSEAGPSLVYQDLIFSQLKPGVLVGISGLDKAATQAFVAQLDYAYESRLVRMRAGTTATQTKRECLVQRAPGLRHITEAQGLQVADIVYHLDGDTLTLVKHRTRGI